MSDSLVSARGNSKCAHLESVVREQQKHHAEQRKLIASLKEEMGRKHTYTVENCIC